MYDNKYKRIKTPIEAQI